MHAADPAIAKLQAEIVSLQQQVAALEPLAALAPFVSVDLGAPKTGFRDLTSYSRE